MLVGPADKAGRYLPGRRGACNRPSFCKILPCPTAFFSLGYRAHRIVSRRKATGVETGTQREQRPDSAVTNGRQRHPLVFV
jgi:hypothetical protein